MNKTLFFRTVKFTGKLILLSLTIVLFFAYSIALTEKIKHPNFKNLQTEEFIFIGIILLLLIFINLKLVLGVFKTKLNEK